jgi:2-dehydro-3-deoxyphosphogluconate aldolase/(4S)-4-hydroxy-2-oxoglutarate aldolase
MILKQPAILVTETRTEESLPIWLQGRVIPVIRSTTPESALWIATLLIQAGATALEFTLTTPDVWQVYQAFKQQCQQAHTQCYVGMGSVKTRQQLEQCLTQGVAFTAAPGYIPYAYHIALAEQHCHLGGAITPSELNQVVLEGGQCVKLFPVVPMGGVSYFKTVASPFPELTLIPCGGILPNQVAAYQQAGAKAVGLGSQLMPHATWVTNNQPESYLDFLHQTQLFGNTP